MARLTRYLGQGVVYALIALVLGYFSSAPAYVHLPPDQALIKISFRHGGARKVACRRRSAKEIAKLAPNMRKAMVCSRERVPVLIVLEIDGKTVLREALPPTGLSKDGPSRIYRSFPVPAGRHHIAARLRDSRRTEGFDYEREADIVFEPGRNFAIDFRAETGGFIFR